MSSGTTGITRTLEQLGARARQRWTREAGEARSSLVRASAGTLVLKVANAGLAFVVSILLARSLGVEGYGVYAYAMALVGLLNVPAGLGLPALVTRNVATYDASGDWGHLRGLLQAANGVVLGASLVLALAAGSLAWWLGGGEVTPRIQVLWVALATLPLGALARLRGASLQGLRQVVLGQLPEAVIRPALFILLVAGALAARGTAGVGPLEAAALQVVAVGLAFGVGLVLLLRHLPPQVHATPARWATPAWARSALPFLLLGGLDVVNSQTDLVMLGALAGPHAVGLYRVVVVGAQMVVFGLGAVNAALRPVVARAYARRDAAELQQVVTTGARAILALTLPPVLLLVAWPGALLRMLYGPEFVPGAQALRILALAQVVNAGAGSAGTVLNMTGHERDSAWGMGAGAVLNVLLNALLIPRWGIEGAAAATSASLVTWNLVLVLLVRRRLGIDTTALGRTAPPRPGRQRAGHRCFGPPEAKQPEDERAMEQEPTAAQPRAKG